MPGTRSANAPQDAGGAKAAEQEHLPDAVERRGEGSGVFEVAYCDLHACGERCLIRIAARARTDSPRATSARVSSLPTFPVAPVTRIMAVTPGC
jgi:hypothetical protein